MGDYVEVNPAICSGKPVIRGTRIMVKNILGMVAGGSTVERICKEYPVLEPKAVQAALEYAAQVVDVEKVIAHG